MGYSAGGHLALLYAYKAAAGHTVNGNPMHDISLVISEAGPIEFIAGNMTNLADKRKAEICAMAGISSLDDTNAQIALNAVSPCSILESITCISAVPYTILAYGCNIETPDIEEYDGTKVDGDGLIAIAPAEMLESYLGNNCNLNQFPYVDHNDFGVYENGDIKMVHPNNSIDEFGNTTIIGNYYDDIITQLAMIKNQ